MFLLLLQHVTDGSAALYQTIIAAAATGLGGYLIRAMVQKPAEKVELYEQAKIQTIADSLAEVKQDRQRTMIDWQAWRSEQEKRITTLELQSRVHAEQLNEKFGHLSEELAEMKHISQQIRETLATLKSQMDQTIKKWS